MKQLQDFDLSIIIPFYKRIGEFKRVLPEKAPYLRRNGIEVIIVADEPTEQDDLLDCIRLYPFINWRVIVNHNDHPWRNPAKALNVGIRMATKKYILVMDPELECYSDVIYILREHLDSYPEHFAVGQVFISVKQYHSYRSNQYHSYRSNQYHFFHPLVDQICDKLSLYFSYFGF